MTKKQITKFAKQLAEAELIIKTSEDKESVQKAKERIYSIGNQVSSFEDMMLIDDMTQKILEKILDK